MKTYKFHCSGELQSSEKIEKTHMSCQKNEETVKHKDECRDSHYRSTEKGKNGESGN